MMIRKATAADIPAIAAIYNALLDREEQGLLTTGWTRGIYPTEQTALDALTAGTLYVLEDEGRVTAAAKIDQHQMPQYAQCPWQYEAPPERVLVPHVGSRPRRQGQGVWHRLRPVLRAAGPRDGAELPAHRHQCPQRPRPHPVRPSGLYRGGHHRRQLQRYPRRTAGLSGKNRLIVAYAADIRQNIPYTKENHPQRRTCHGHCTRNDAEL